MRTVPVLILLCAMHGAAAAAEPPPAAAACIECHAREYQRTSVPQLEGQHAAYLRMELTHFREKHRRAFPMDQIAQDLDDADIEALADWFSRQPWGAWRFAADPARVAEGAQLVDRFQCAACHGAGFTGTEVIPRTAGQNPVYLARQLRAFSRGDRYHPPTGTGARMFRLSEAEVESLALFLAQMPAP
ncbi:MAG: c-type cytochrome [Xanthomonadaceae bacterium]|jgi:cytochrome c553|nr:c-type cytochrome [Xanthomonadaceae bacterium]